jgi:hypothetical protein
MVQATDAPRKIKAIAASRRKVTGASPESKIGAEPGALRFPMLEDEAGAAAESSAGGERSMSDA